MWQPRSSGITDYVYSIRNIRSIYQNPYSTYHLHQSQGFAYSIPSIYVYICCGSCKDQYIVLYDCVTN